MCVLDRVETCQKLRRIRMIRARRCDYELDIFLERLLISFSRERFFFFSMDRSSRFSGPSCEELGGDTQISIPTNSEKRGGVVCSGYFPSGQGDTRNPQHRGSECYRRVNPRGLGNVSLSLKLDIFHLPLDNMIFVFLRRFSMVCAHPPHSERKTSSFGRWTPGIAVRAEKFS